MKFAPKLNIMTFKILNEVKKNVHVFFSTYVNVCFVFHSVKHKK